MKHVLFIGQTPETVDFSDPALPPGFNAEKINAGIAVAVQAMQDKGWKPRDFMIPPDASGLQALEKELAANRYDCVVIGAGLRQPPKGLPFFEQVVNAVHQGAPKTPIAFNTRPEDTADAAARWIKDR